VSWLGAARVGRIARGGGAVRLEQRCWMAVVAWGDTQAVCKEGASVGSSWCGGKSNNPSGKFVASASTSRASSWVEVFGGVGHSTSQPELGPNTDGLS
jgi:hypothetical protein